MFPLYVDEDSMHRGLVAALRCRELDVVTVQEAKMRGRTDASQLALATTAGRALYSANVPDFARLHHQVMASGEHHSGITLLTDQSWSVGEQLRGLIAILTARSAEDMVDKLEFLSNWR